MTVAENHVVAISYTLKEKGSDTIIEKVEENDPFIFLFGAGNLLEKFEENLSGKTKDENFDFILLAPDAYGVLEADAIVDVPIEVFMNEGKLMEDIVIPGKQVRLVDQQGNPLTGIVLERGLEKIKIDFNHPMAGKDLHFAGKVIEIRKATDEEIAHGHVHGPGGHHH
jgi:FKBP-type peptidyl-prolyl cis-trans isomerase SlyD